MSDAKGKIIRLNWLMIFTVVFLGLTTFFWWNKAEQQPENGSIKKMSTDWNYLDQAGVDIQVITPIEAETVTYEIWEYQAGSWQPVKNGAYSASTGSKGSGKEETISIIGYADGSFLLTFLGESKIPGNTYSLGTAERGTAFISSSQFQDNNHLGLNTPFPLLYVGYTDSPDCSKYTLDIDDFFREDGPSDYPLEYEGYRILTVTFSHE